MKPKAPKEIERRITELTRKEIEHQLAELKGQLNALVEAEWKENEHRLQACAKACREAGLHKCFTPKLITVTARTEVRAKLRRSYIRKPDAMSRVEAKVEAETEWRAIEKKVDCLAKMEEARMEGAFAKIRGIIAEHGLSDKEPEVFELLDPEGGW